jgi:hypothetical protein
MRSVVIALVSVVVLAAVLWAAIHVFIPPVNPAQTSPKGHVAGPCWACHMVTEAAPVGSE